jgi:hypothetical protein
MGEILPGAKRSRSARDVAPLLDGVEAELRKLWATYTEAQRESGPRQGRGLFFAASAASPVPADPGRRGRPQALHGAWVPQVATTLPAGRRERRGEGSARGTSPTRSTSLLPGVDRREARCGMGGLPEMLDGIVRGSKGTGS